MPKTIFVTGGAGYVGSHCCKAFAEAGWNVVVYDNLSTGHRDFVRWGPFIEGDILDAEALRKAMADARPDAVAHFAALSLVNESVTAPERYYRTNVGGTLNLLEAMVANDVRKMIFSSTCATYGVHDTPISEETHQKPINPYGWSKLAAERAIIDFDRAHGVKSVLLRYFNACGASPDGEIGERHEPEPHVIPRAVMGAMDGSFEFKILGNDYDTPDGSCIRDYIHVMDLAAAHRLALETLFDAGASDVFNLGTGSGTSVIELADAIANRSPRNVPREYGPRREGDPAMLIANPTKANTVLRWRPVRSDIATIVDDAWRWHEKELGVKPEASK